MEIHQEVAVVGKTFVMLRRVKHGTFFRNWAVEVCDEKGEG